MGFNSGFKGLNLENQNENQTTGAPSLSTQIKKSYSLFSVLFIWTFALS
jgi:hypothetical protein